MINIDKLKDRLSKNSAEDFDYHEATTLFKRPPMLNSNLLAGDHFIIGVRGAGKSTLLYCYYSFLFAYSLCELSKGRKISYFPIIIRLKADKNMSTHDAFNLINSSMKEGIINTFEDIRSCNKIPGWLDKYINIPLSYMAEMPEFKDIISEFYDCDQKKFLFENEFYNEKFKGGYIDNLLKSSTFLLPDIDKAEKPEELDDICSKFFSEGGNNSIEKFVFLIDNISGFRSDFYTQNGEFSDLLECFRKCKSFHFLISIIQSSQSESIARQNGAFFNFSSISFNLNSIEELKKTRNFIIEVFRKFLQIPDIYELIDIEDSIDDDTTNYSGQGDALEQLIFASRGMPRTAFVILLLAINKHRRFSGLKEITPLSKEEILDAIKEYADKLLAIPNGFLRYSQMLSNICSDHKTYKFYGDYNDQILRKCTLSENNEPFLLCIEECNINGQSGYMFHYAHSVSNNIPTHYSYTNNCIDYNRSLFTGEWIKESTNILYNESKDEYLNNGG